MVSKSWIGAVRSLCVLAPVILLFGGLALPCSGSSFDGAKPARMLNYSLRDMGMPFIENVGQIDQSVRFYAMHAYGNLVVTREGAMVHSVGGARITETLSGSRRSAPEGRTPSPVKVSYFRGKDPSQWKAAVPVYGEVSMGEVYPGIALTLRTAERSIEKVFRLAPGANPEDIAFSVEGAPDVALTETGELQFFTPTATVAFTRPLAYQEIEGKRVEIPIAYRLLPPETGAEGSGERYGFALGQYDRTGTLVIDPLIASTFIGGSAEESSVAISLDSQGNLFLAGIAQLLPGSSPSSGNTDIFLAKLSRDLSRLLGFVVLGGYRNDSVSSMAIDADDNIFIAGKTESSTFPTTPGAYQESSCAPRECPAGFVSKLSNDLAELLASTFYWESAGYNNYHEVTSLQVDRGEGVYIAGTASFHNPNEPVPPFFIARLTGDLSQRTAHAGFEAVRGVIALDPDGDVLWAGVLGTNYNNTGCATVQKFSPGLTRVKASYSLSQSSTCSHTLTAMTVDQNGNVHVAGSGTVGSSTPPEAFQVSYRCGGFLAKLDGGLSEILAATYLGYSAALCGITGITVDHYGNVHVTGTAIAYEGHRPFPWGDPVPNTAFVNKFDPFLTRLLFSHDVVRATWKNVGNAIVLDGEDGVFIAGTTSAADFPVTEGAYDTSFAEETDAFVSHIGIATPGKFTASEYFPLLPGMTWTYWVDDYDTVTYKVLDKKVALGATRANVVQNMSKGDEEYITSDERGVLLHGMLKVNVPVGISGRVSANVRIVYDPPVTLLEGVAETGQNFFTTGVVKQSGGGMGTGPTAYRAYSTAETFGDVAVPAGEFPVVIISQKLVRDGYSSTTQKYYLARGIGQVKNDGKDYLQKKHSMELISTNAHVRDLAVTEISAPATITLSAAQPKKTATVGVTIQNRTPFQETIASAATLRGLIALAVESLGACPAPEAVLKTEQIRFPVVLKSKQTLKVAFEVPFSCVNDPARSKPAQSHADYRYRAYVNRSVLDGMADVHADDDWCPRSVTVPYQIDPYPDGTIRDKGCGGRKADGTLGGDVFTDLVK